jgi:dienelactone hydrolase
VAVVANRDLGPDAAFDYPRAEVPVSNHMLGRGKNSRYQLRRLEIPSIGDNGQNGDLITARYFQSTKSGPRPLVIVLPIWAKFTYPSRKISSYLQNDSNGGVHVLDVQGEDFLVDWAKLAEAPDEASFIELWEVAAERERVTMVDVRRLVDWAHQRPEIDGSRIALIGFSHGAFVAGTVATQEPRLAATVLVMGSAHPNEIIAHCIGDRTTMLQDKVAQNFGWTRDDFAARLEPIFRGVDPATYPGRVDPRRVLIFEAGRDHCAPEPSRTALWETMGRPERIILNYGHRRAFLSMTPLGGSWMCREIWEFLQGWLIGE